MKPGGLLIYKDMASRPRWAAALNALHDLIERKRKSKGAKIEAQEEDAAPSRGSNVVDLMAALKKSIEKPGDAKKPTTKKAPAKKSAPARKRA